MTSYSILPGQPDALFHQTCVTEYNEQGARSILIIANDSDHDMLKLNVHYQRDNFFFLHHMIWRDCPSLSPREKLLSQGEIGCHFSCSLDACVEFYIIKLKNNDDRRRCAS